MAKRLMALIVCTALASGCATSGGMRVMSNQRVTGGQSGSDGTRQAMDRALLSDYVQKLALGSRVRVDKVNGRTVKGTLIKAGDQGVVVQPRTRMPEPPVEIPLDQIVAVMPEPSSNLAKAAGIGLAAGLGGTLLAFAILAGIFSD